MALIPWRSKDSLWGPFRDLETIQDEMNKLFDSSLVRFGDRNFGVFDKGWIPLVDVYDSNDSVTVKVDMPGMSKEDIEVSVHGDILTIKGEKKHEKEIKEKGYVRRERGYGVFSRTLRLPAEIESAKVDAKYKDGVLELSLPKKEESKPKQIKIDIK